jgi:hypothetical protein
VRRLPLPWWIGLASGSVFFWGAVGPDGAGVFAVSYVTGSIIGSWCADRDFGR